jgi:hypothetical protein
MANTGLFMGGAAGILAYGTAVKLVDKECFYSNLYDSINNL